MSDMLEQQTNYILKRLQSEGYIEEASYLSYHGSWNFEERKYDVKPGASNCPQIQIRNGRSPKSEEECMIAVLEALILQGCVIAWPGDGTSCVAQMIWAMHKRAEKTEKELAKLQKP
jgi:hypothetical protein